MTDEVMANKAKHTEDQEVILLNQKKKTQNKKKPEEDTTIINDDETLIGECSICCETFTKMTRKPISCPHCEFKGCIKCVKRYTLSYLQDLQCMSCKKPWNLEFLDTHFSRYFRITIYKKHRENLLLEREKVFLADTQVIIETNQSQIQILEKDLKILRKERDEILEKIKIKTRQKNALMDDPSLTIDDISVLPFERGRFTRKCPKGDCRGYINNKNHCGICKSAICPECLELLKTNPKTSTITADKSEDEQQKHECDPNTIESVKAMKKDCKSCPNCHISIYKINGCDQMWCTQCHIAFDWKTLHIIRQRTIHNPHYYDYVNRVREEERTGGIHQDAFLDECNPANIPSFFVLRTFFHQSPSFKKYWQYFSELHRSLNHIIDVEINRFPILTEAQILRGNLHHRIRFLQNKISETKFKEILIREEKLREKNKSFRLLFEMLITVCNSIFQELFSSCDTVEQLENNILVKFKNIRNYTNEQLTILVKRFNISFNLTIHNDWSLR